MMVLLFDVWRFHTVYLSSKDSYDIRVEAQYGMSFDYLLELDQDTLLHGLLATFAGDKREIVKLLTRRAHDYVRRHHFSIKHGRPDDSSVECLSVVHSHSRLIRALVLNPDSRPSYPKGVTSKWLHIFDTVRAVARDIHPGVQGLPPSLDVSCAAISSLWTCLDGERHLILCLRRQFVEGLVAASMNLPMDISVVDETLGCIERGLIHRSAASAVSVRVHEHPGLPPTVRERLENLSKNHAVARFARALEARLMRVCSNQMCAQQALSGDLRRCPCGFAFYCSRSCQKADWRARHCQICDAHSGSETDIPPRIRSYLFALRDRKSVV